MASLKTLLFGRENRIARRLVVLTVAFSSAITLIISAVQLVSEYRELRSDMENSLDGVGIFVPTLSGSVWNFDEEQIRLTLDALKQLPNVDQVAVSTPDKYQRWATGKELSAHLERRTYTLRQYVRGKDMEIGMLEVTAGLDAIYRHLVADAVWIVLSNGLKTFLVALFMILLLRRLVTSRLEQLARKVSAMGPKPIPAGGARDELRPIPARLDELDAVGWAIDNTAGELRRAEAEQRLAASVFDHAQEAIVITDANPDARIVTVNKRFSEITGYSAAEAIGCNPRILKSGKQGVDFYRAMWASISADGYWTGEIWNRRKDGRVFPEWLSISSVRDERGQATNYVAVFVDISRRVAAEQALRESERLYRTMFDSAPVGVWMLGPDRLTTAVNRNMCSLIGYAREDMLGCDPVQFTDEANGRIFRANADLASSRQTRTYEIALRCRDGRNIQTEFNVTSLFNEDGSVMAVLALVVDLSARKEHEKELQRLHQDLERRVVERTQALEVANRELEAFSYAVSHDLRAPLRAIEGFSSLLEREYAAQIDERGRDYFRRVRSGATRMATLIDDLLELSRISRQEMTSGPVNLSALAVEVAEELRATEPERRVAWAIAPDLSAVGDSGLMRIVLQNLMGNAWKYSSKRETARIEFGVGQWNGRPAFFVRDNGDGFDMAYADKLFGAFQRLHSADEFPGTGIGLATVARIIRRHGGTVGAEGKVHEGATFYFTL